MVASAPTRSLPVIPKYDVIEEIGHGGMATVYRAMDKRLAREVAVKVIHPHLRESAEVAHRFVVEAQAVAKLRHPNIVEVFDVSAEDDPEKFLVVELIRGATLRKLVKDEGPLPPEVAAAIAIDVLAALIHAHAEGVIHRDVKPENVLIEHTPSRSADAPNRVRVKLTDFGIAKLLDAQGVTSTGQVLGSPAHMAPEQIEGGAVDARADVFGVGVMLYEAMVGHLPFEGQNPAQVLRRVLEGQYPSAEMEQPTIGKRLSVILDRSLAHDASERLESATVMRELLISELGRVGIDSPSRELEAYFDDPEGYKTGHTKRTIAKLCDLAQIARKDGRALDAAADYNRALAYAPNDPQLLRIVARMQRDAARRRMLQRAWPLALATVVTMVAAYFLTGVIKNRQHPLPVTNDTSTASALATPSASALASASASAPASASASVAIALTTTAPTATVKVERTITLTLVPPNVMVAIDNGEGERKSTGDKITLNERDHVLRFGCADDACETQTKAIAAGKRDDAISVELKIKQATIVVSHADANVNLGIEEYPGITVSVGRPVSVIVPSYRFVTLIDRNNPTTHRQKVDVRPGHQTDVEKF